MSNYINQNLINIAASGVPSGTLAFKVGDHIFTAGGTTLTQNELQAYVVVDVSGTLMAQKLAFTGTQPSDSGQPEQIINIKIFNTGHSESSGFNSINFYKCATRETADPFYRVSGAGTADCNGDYYDTGLTYQGQPVYSMISTTTGTTWYLFSTGSYYCINTEYEGIMYGLSDTVYYMNKFNKEITNTYYVQNKGTSPAPTVTEQAPLGGAGWTGYKAVQDPQIGAWSFEQNITSGLVYTAFIPEVGKVYDEHATIEANLYTRN